MYHEITVWTRGIIMDKEARDIANSLAQAARRDGRRAIYISDYVDSPDRTNCLVRKYARISDGEIQDTLTYENPHPDIVVLVEETLIKAVDYTRTTPPGEGVVVVDAVGDDSKRWLYKNLTGLGFDRLSTEGAAELAAVGGGISAPLLGATARGTGCVSLEALEGVVADPAGARRGYEECQILEADQLAEAVHAVTAS